MFSDLREYVVEAELAVLERNQPECPRAEINAAKNKRRRIHIENLAIAEHAARMPVPGENRQRIVMAQDVHNPSAGRIVLEDEQFFIGGLKGQFLL